MSVQLGKKENKLTDRPENVLVIGGNPVQAVMLCRQLLFLYFLRKMGKKHIRANDTSELYAFLTHRTGRWSSVECIFPLSFKIQENKNYILSHMGGHSSLCVIYTMHLVSTSVIYNKYFTPDLRS